MVKSILAVREAFGVYSRLLMVLLLGVCNCFVTCFCSAQPLNYINTAFAPNSWVLFREAEGGSVSYATQVGSGGYPGAYLAVTNICAGDITSFVYFLGATYNPGSQGALSSIECSFDHTVLDQPYGQGISVAVRQNGINYWAISADISYPHRWTPFCWTKLTAQDFRTWASYSAHPDFSAAGAPLQFGIFNYNIAASGTRTTESGFDNFIVRSAGVRDLIANKLVWNNQIGGVDMVYLIDGLSLPKDVPVQLFWANGTTRANILGPAIFTKTIPQGTGPVGNTTIPVPADVIRNPRDGATHLLMEIDHDGAITEATRENNIKPLSLKRRDIAATALEVSLQFANAVYSYEVAGEEVPADTKIGLFWARGPKEADIVSPVAPPIKIPRNSVGSFSGHISALTLSPPLVPPSPDVKYILLFVDSTKLVDEVTFEDNNLFPFPLNPIEPTFQLVVARISPVTTASGVNVVAEDAPIWRKEPYKVWLRVTNNMNHDIIVAGGWWESLPTAAPRMNEDPQFGTFIETVIGGGQVKFLPLGVGASDVVFRHTWDWVPPAETFTISEASLKVFLDLLNIGGATALDNLVEHLIDGGPVPIFHFGIEAYELDRLRREMNQALAAAVPQRNVELHASMDWWPLGQSSGQARLKDICRSQLVEVHIDQRRAYRRYWIDRIMEKLYIQLLTISPFEKDQPYACLTPILYLTAASKSYELAVDPPDPNFREVAVPNTNRPIELDGMPDGPKKQFTLTLFERGAVGDAIATAINRAAGAEAASEFAWQARQLVAAAGYLRASALLQLELLERYKEIAPELIQVVAANKSSLIPSLQQNGLPPLMVERLTALGWTALEIEAYRRNLTDLGTKLLDEPGLFELGTVLSAFTDAADGWQQLSTATSIRRSKLGLVPSTVTTDQRQLLAASQTQIEAELVINAAALSVSSQIGSYLSNLYSMAEQIANPGDLVQEIAFGDAALGIILARASGAENYLDLEIQAATNEVVLTWPAFSSFALETSSNLGSTNWARVSATPTNQLGQMQARLTPASSAAFFRLRKVDPVPTISANLEGTNVGGTFLVRSPQIAGVIADGVGISNLVGGFVTGGGVTFTDLSAGLSPYFRRFTLGRTQLEQINGGPLADGLHTFRLKAIAGRSNIVSSIDFTFQLDTHPPTLYFSNSVVDIDAITPGIQVAESSTLNLRSGVFDEVGVSNLVLLMNGEVVATGSRFPWEDFVIRAPSYVAGSNAFSIQTRGTDLAGNVTMSAPFDFEVIEDTTNLEISSIDPPNGANLHTNRSQVFLRFTKPISAESLSVTNFALVEAGAGGLFDDGNDVPVPISGLLLGEDETLLRVDFAPVGLGSYQFGMAASRIVDRMGHVLGTNDWTARFTITAVAGPVNLTILDTSVEEGNLGTTNATFLVTLSAYCQDPVSVNYWTVDGTAYAGSGYVATNGSLTVAPGTISAFVVVPVKGDIIIESNEVFSVKLTGAVNATLVNTQATATIVNDDGLPARLHHFEWLPIASPQTNTIPFPVIILARDIGGQTVSNFTGVVTLTASNGTTGQIIVPAPGASGNFTNGVWVGTVTLAQTGTNVVLRAIDAEGHDGWANAINVMEQSPDLAFLSVTLSGELMPGQSVTVVGLVTNRGYGVAQISWRDRIYLCTNTTLSAPPYFPLASVRWTNQSVPSGGSYRFTNSATVPTFWTWKTSYLIAQTDWGNDFPYDPARENNQLVVPVTVHHPDLAPVSVSWTNEAVAGQSLTVMMTVTNQGDGAARGAWYDRMYLSSDAVWDSQDLQLSSVLLTNQTVAIGGSYSVAHTVRLPDRPPGTYYLVGRADTVFNSLTESVETNNDLAVPIVLHVPDLAPLSISWSEAPEALLPLTVVVVVTNQGNGTARGNWFDRVYLSSNAVWDAQDVLLGSIQETNLAIPGGSSCMVTNIVNLPSRAPGTYYLIVRIDSENSLYESVETNNTLVVPMVIMIPDLAVSRIELLGIARPNAPVDVLLAVTNVGSGPARYGWCDRLTLSTNATLEGAISTWTKYSTVNYLEPGSEDARVLTIHVPVVPAGIYYLIVEADSCRYISEDNESNNTSAAFPFEVRMPDLVISSLAVVGTAELAQVLNVRWSVANIGNGAANYGWNDRITVSSNASLSGAITYGNSFSTTNYLGAGSVYEGTVSIALPVLPSGTYYLIGKTDTPDNNVVESSETNNLSAPIPFFLTTADLMVSRLSVLNAPKPNSQLNVFLAVTNIGTAPARFTWGDRLTLSTNATLAGAINTWVKYSSDSYLAPGAEDGRVLTIHLPDVPLGIYYLILEADALHYIYEDNENNNTSDALPIELK